MRKLKHTEGNAQAHTTVSGFKPEPVWLLNLHFNHYLLLGSCENWDKASKLLNSVSDTLKPLKKHQSLFLWPWFTCHFSISGSEWLHLLFLFFFFFFPLGNVPEVGGEIKHPSGNSLPLLWTCSRKKHNMARISTQFRTRPNVPSHYLGWIQMRWGYSPRMMLGIIQTLGF